MTLNNKLSYQNKLNLIQCHYPLITYLSPKSCFLEHRQLVRRKVNIHLHTHTLIWCVESRKSNILSGTREKERTKTSFVYPHQNRSRTFSKALFWWKIHDINQTASLTNEIEQEVLQHRHIVRATNAIVKKKKTTLDVLICSINVKKGGSIIKPPLNARYLRVKPNYLKKQCSLSSFLLT